MWNVSLIMENTIFGIDKKYTTGAPHFIETGHLEPAPVSEEVVENVKKIVFHALDSLKIVMVRHIQR